MASKKFNSISIEQESQIITAVFVHSLHYTLTVVLRIMASLPFFNKAQKKDGRLDPSNSKSYRYGLTRDCYSQRFYCPASHFISKKHIHDQSSSMTKHVPHTDPCRSFYPGSAQRSLQLQDRDSAGKKANKQTKTEQHTTPDFHSCIKNKTHPIGGLSRQIYNQNQHTNARFSLL